MTQDHLDDDAGSVERYLTRAEHDDPEMQTSPGLRYLERIEKVPDTHFVNSELRDSGALSSAILSREFSGRLMPQDPNDEAASVPFERIRTQRAAAEADKNNKKRSSRPSRLRGENKNCQDAKIAKKPTENLQTVLPFLQPRPTSQAGGGGSEARLASRYGYPISGPSGLTNRELVHDDTIFAQATLSDTRVGWYLSQMAGQFWHKDC